MRAMCSMMRSPICPERALFRDVALGLMPSGP
jgi:hypothetical protein